MRAVIVALPVVLACANDPQYIAAPSKLVAAVDATGNLSAPVGSMSLPIKPESAADRQARMTLANQLGVMVPYVKVGDLEIEIDWTITNADTANPGTAAVSLNGGNELFYYDPNNINLTPPGSDDPLVTPPLAGGTPIDIPAGGSVSGLFREDQLLEASVDTDMITRGNNNPFTVLLTINKYVPSFQLMTAAMVSGMAYTQSATGTSVPRAAFAEMVCFQIVFKPDRPMTLEYDVRVRDIRGTLIDPMGLGANGAVRSGDVTFSPAAYTAGSARATAQSPCMPM